VTSGTLRTLRKVTTTVARIRGGRLLVEPVRRMMARYARDISVIDYDGDLSLDLRLDEHMESHIFWRGYYSRDLLCVIDARLGAGATFLDVGANVGEVTLFAAKRVGAHGQVISIEPSPEVVGRLRVHVAKNALAQVRIIECALGREPGRLELFRADRGADTLHHSGLTTAFRSEERSIRVATVPVRPLDELLAEERIDVLDAMKIDVEGGEMDVLYGAMSTLRRFRPWIILEVNRDTCLAAGYRQEALLDLLSGVGYGFQRIGRAGRLLPLETSSLSDFQNVLCVHRTKAG